MQDNESYDLSVYPQIWDDRAGAIDKRHLFWMFDILNSGCLSSALEIGCLNGASSTAFVEAMNRGKLSHATFCDTGLRSSLLQVLTRCKNFQGCRAFQVRSEELLNGSSHYDFVFVDGDHSLGTVVEEVYLLLRNPPLCVMAHDTNAQAAGFRDFDGGDCAGPSFLKRKFQTTMPYFCLEDNEFREGEATHRGMFFATTSASLFEIARASLSVWSKAVLRRE